MEPHLRVPLMNHIGPEIAQTARRADDVAAAGSAPGAAAGSVTGSAAEAAVGAAERRLLSAEHGTAVGDFSDLFRCTLLPSSSSSRMASLVATSITDMQSPSHKQQHAPQEPDTKQQGHQQVHYVSHLQPYQQREKTALAGFANERSCGSLGTPSRANLGDPHLHQQQQQGRDRLHQPAGLLPPLQQGIVAEATSGDTSEQEGSFNKSPTALSRRPSFYLKARSPSQCSNRNAVCNTTGTRGAPPR